MDKSPFNKPRLQQEFRDELTGNILPFWINHAVDRANGGFYGAVTNDLKINNHVQRSLVLCARILWTYAAAYRILGREQYLEMAHRAYNYLTGVFLDRDYGGFFWLADRTGKPVQEHKQNYGQAFAIYALSEYYRTTNKPKSLNLARALFQLMEKHTYNKYDNGYIEATTRKWKKLEHNRLSENDIASDKSMNTMLHILEAYTNLLRVWDNNQLRIRIRSIIDTFQRFIIDQKTGHFKCYFDKQWQSLSDKISFGHDIEGSWLLVEAAAVLGDAQLSAQVYKSCLNMAEVVYREGRDKDGSIFYEGDTHRLTDTSKAWWVQAEAIVGFYNAYQLSAQPHFARAACQCWQYVKNKMVDKKHGDWFKLLDRQGRPLHSVYKIGPWECPYHHSRACLEMIRRLNE